MSNELDLPEWACCESSPSRLFDLRTQCLYFSEVGLCIVLVELGRIRSSHPCWVFPLLTRFSSECAATCRDALFRFSVASCETMRQSSVPRLSASAACYCTRDMNFDGIESAKDAEKFVEKELRVFIREHFKSDAAKPISGSKKHMVVDYVWRKIKESKNADGTASKMFNIKPGNCSDCKERTSRILQEKMLLDVESAQATHEGAFAHHQLPSSSTSSTLASGHPTFMVPNSARELSPSRPSLFSRLRRTHWLGRWMTRMTRSF